MTNVLRAPAPVEIQALEEGFGLLRGGRRLLTPAGLALMLPTHALASAIATEWNDAPQDPARRPLTRLANTTIDRARVARQRVEAELMNYALTDLLCYRAESEPRLAAREAAAWDPLLEWAAAALGARLRVAPGIAPVTQCAEALEALQRALGRESAFALTALHAIAALTGSLVLAFALARGRCDAEEVWVAATIEEAWQAERWGVDGKAQTRAAAGKVELYTLARFTSLADA